MRGLPLACALLCLAAPLAAAPLDPVAPPTTTAPAPTAPTIESVRLRGVRVVRRQALRSRIDIAPGTPLDEDRVRAARLNLLSTGLFRSVSASLEKGSARGKVVLVFVCSERGTASLDAFHLGHARPTDLWGGFEASDLDPFALGVSVGGGVVASENQHAARLTLGRRGVVTADLDLALSGFYINGNEPLPFSDRTSLGGEPGLLYRRAGGDLSSRYRTGGISLLVGVRGEWVQSRGSAFPDDPFTSVIDAPSTSSSTAGYELPFGDSGQAVLSVGAEYDGRDDPAHPSRGLRASILARGGTGAGTFAGALLGFDHYLRLPFGHVLRTDAKAGALVGDPPFFERFFIGDLHPYIPARALGLNFARRTGPNLIDSSIVEQRYETVTGRVGLEYRIPLARSGPDDRYGVEVFIGGALLTLFTPDDVTTRDAFSTEEDVGFPLDAAIDFGLRIDSEIGVVGVSVGNIFLLVDP